MYPLSMCNESLGGYAVANDEAEHKALTASGYAPAFVESDQQPDSATATGVHTMPDQAPAEQPKRRGRPPKSAE